MVLPPCAELYSFWYLSDSRNTWLSLQSCHIRVSEWLSHAHFKCYRTSLSFVLAQSPRIWHISNMPITCKGSSPQWSWTLIVSHSTCSHIRIWTALAWIEWGGERASLDIPAVGRVATANSGFSTCYEVQDHRWASVYSILSLCLLCCSFQRTSWFHLNTYPPSVQGRMEGHWTCHGVGWVFRYHTRWSICTCQMCWVIPLIWSDFDWSSPSPVLVEAHSPIRKASFNAWLLRTGCSYRDNRCFHC